jgi:hypothetical protein
MKSVPPALHPLLPANPLPIVLIGAGGIVRAAHLPAYQKSNFPVTGVYDLNLDRAKALAAEFGIPRVYATAFTTWTCCDLFWESLREYMQIRSADLQRDGLDRRLFSIMAIVRERLLPPITVIPSGFAIRKATSNGRERRVQSRRKWGFS